MKDQRLGSWTSSGPTLLVIGGISLSGLLVEIVEWFVTQRLPQPRFANLPLLYVPLAGWLIYKAFREPPLLKCLLIALAGSLILMSLGPS